ncbi:MAG TPA: ABC transporter permease [Chthoniobacterales bacterium]|nr:ABC transporter permease [Chthoniobacterales bacterium]
MMTDFRFALRQLRKSPGFTLLAVLTLALGIGLNTTIFSLIHALFLRGLPFPEPGRIVRIYGESKERELNQLPYSVPRFSHYRDGQSAFSGLAADNGLAMTLSGLGEPVQINAQTVTANYFDVLGVRPIRGRVFLPEEEMKADVAMISEGFWRNRLGGDPAVLGRSITLNDVPHTIVGVLPNMPVAWFGPDLEVYTAKPFDLPGTTRERLARGIGFLRVIGRLRPGVTIEQAKASMPSLENSYRAQNPANDDNSWTTSLVTVPEDVSGNLRPAFTTLLAAVCFVLLIACSNVANLLLVRFSGRRREIALRMALGAARTGVVRLFVFESTLVSLLGGLLGAALAWKLIPLIPRLAADNLPLEREIGLSLPVLAFTLGLSLLTGLVMGLYPAWQSSRADLVDGLKDGGRAVSGSLRQQRLRKILVGAQVALSVTLLAGAALLIASFVRLSRQETGFRAEHLWLGALRLPTAHYPDLPARARFGERLLQQLRGLPGIESASLSDAAPLEGGSRIYYARPDGNPPPVNQRPIAPNRTVSVGFFRTLGIPLLAGRVFDERDTLDRPKVMLISQAGAKKIFPGQNALGRELLLGGAQERVQIVGIVGDVRSTQLTVATEAEFYRPWAQETTNYVRLAVRSSAKSDEVLPSVRSALAQIDAGLPIFNTATMESVVAGSLGQQRLMMTLLGVFAGIALLLATVGIYGAVAYTVEQRTGEIGVRMALGAQTADVLRLVIAQGMKPVFFGLAAGIGAALALGRLLAAQLYEISPYNPLLLASTAAILALAALLACLLPARRASLLSPVSALRAD